jgi:AcrR family transcriptional regulator
MTDMSVRAPLAPVSQSRKDQLIDAAVHVFHEKGFQKTRIADIVAEAGVAQGTFYLYFKSKEEIFKDICITHMNRFVKVFKETRILFGGNDNTEVKRNIHVFLQKLLEIYKCNVHVSELLFREGPGHGGLYKDLVQNFFTNFVHLIREYMKRDVSPDQYRKEDAEALSVFLFGVFERSAFYFMLMKKEFDTEKLAGQMTDFMLNGLKLDETALSSN